MSGQFTFETSLYSDFYVNVFNYNKYRGPGILSLGCDASVHVQLDALSKYQPTNYKS